MNLPPIACYPSNSLIPFKGNPKEITNCGTYTLNKFPLSVCHPTGRFIANTFLLISENACINSLIGVLGYSIELSEIASTTKS